MNLLLRIAGTSVAVWVAAWLVPGLGLGPTHESGGVIVTLVLASLVIGLVNSVVKPVVKALSGCLILLTFGLFLLVPSIVAGTITLGLMTQITNVFGQVRGSFQYLISSWTTLVELMSIYKRLRSFERELDDKDLQEVTHTLG